MSDRSSARRIVQLEAQLAEERAELEATLGELRYQMQPKVQAQILMSEATEAVQRTAASAKETVSNAIHGDREAILRILTVSASVAAVVGLVTWRVYANTGVRRQKKQWRRFTRELGTLTPPESVDFSVR